MEEQICNWQAISTSLHKIKDTWRTRRNRAIRIGSRSVVPLHNRYASSIISRLGVLRDDLSMYQLLHGASRASHHRRCRICFMVSSMQCAHWYRFHYGSDSHMQHIIWGWLRNYKQQEIDLCTLPENKLYRRFRVRVPGRCSSLTHTCCRC